MKYIFGFICSLVLTFIFFYFCGAFFAADPNFIHWSSEARFLILVLFCVVSFAFLTFFVSLFTEAKDTSFKKHVSRSDWLLKLYLIEQYCDGVPIEVFMGGIWHPLGDKSSFARDSSQYRIKAPADELERC